METNEVDVLEQDEEINIYDDICDFDFGEEIEKLKAENKKLEEHICSLNGDIDKLNDTIAKLKETQNNLTKNISALFMTAKTEIERKNRMIEELRTQLDNRQISRFNSDVRKRKDRENSPSEVSKSKKFKYDESTAKTEVSVPENSKPEFKSDERQEPKSNYSDRHRHVDDRRYQHRSKYSNDRYNDQFENNRYDTKFRHSNETCSESDNTEFRNKRYTDRYNTYDDDGYHSRSTHLDRYRNEVDDRYDPRAQYFNNRHNDYTYNYADRDEMYNNRDYQHYNRNSRSNSGDVILKDEYKGEQERCSSRYADKRSRDRCDSNYFRNEGNGSSERSSHSRSGTPFTPFASFCSDNREDTSHNIEQDMAIHLTIDAERPRSVTPMPLLEDFEEPKPKPPKKRLKMLEEMEKKVKRNKLSQTSRMSDQSEGAYKKLPDINKTNMSHYDSDRSSIKSSKSSKSDKDWKLEGEAVGNTQRKPNPAPEKVSVKSKTDIRQSPIAPETKILKGKIDSIVVNNEREVKNKTDIRQSPIAPKTKSLKGKIDSIEHRNNEREAKLKSTLDRNMENESKVSSKAAKIVTEQNSSIQEKNIEKDAKRITANTKIEIKPSTEKAFLHQDLNEDKTLKTSQKRKNSPKNNLSTKQAKTNENKIKEKQNQENVGYKAEEKTETPIKNVNKGTKSARNEEIGQKSKSTIHKFEDSQNSEKQHELHKENVEREKVNRELKDGVDSQGKSDENTVVKMVKNKESKLTEESMKSSQYRQSSKERQVTSKESNQENKTIQQTAKQDEKCKDTGTDTKKKQKQEGITKACKDTDIDTEKKQKQEGITKACKDTDLDTEKKQKREDIVKDSSKIDKPNNKSVAEKQKQSKESVKQINDEKNKEEDTMGSNKSSKHSAGQVKPVAVKQVVTKEDKGKDKSPSSKKDKDLKKDDKIIGQSKNQDQLIENQISEVGERGLKENVTNDDGKDQSKKEDDQLIANQLIEAEGKQGLKENLKNDAVKSVNKEVQTNKSKQLQSEAEHNVKPAEDVRRKRRQSTFTEQDDDKKNEINLDKHFENPDIGKNEENRIEEKKTKPSVDSKVNQSPKVRCTASKQNINVAENVPIQTHETAATEQDRAISLQKQAEERPAKILEEKTIHTSKQIVAVDHKIEEHKECNNVKNTEDTDKPKTSMNQGEQRNRGNVVKRRIQFSDEETVIISDQDVDREFKIQNVCNKIASKENNISDAISEVPQVASKNFENCNNIDIPVTTELIEKSNSPVTRNAKITPKNDDSLEANKREVPKSNDKKRRNSSEEESSTKDTKNENVSTTSSSTDSETESQGESSSDILSSVKTDNKLIEIKDVEQETVRQMESIISLSDSSTSDDTIVNTTSNIRTIEKKFNNLINHYIENFVSENISDNPEIVIEGDNNHPAPTEDNPKVEENFLKEQEVAKTSEPKIKVLEVINIVNVQRKPEIHKPSNDVVNPVSSSSKESDIKKSTVTSNSTTQSSSPNSSRPPRRRITPTPVKDGKPLCSFENILTKTCQPETFITTMPTMDSPLHLTHEGEIPILHLDENHINNLPTEVNINDKNILNLLDSMNISNIECDIPKFSAETGTNPEASAGGGDKCHLTFENKIENIKSTPVKSQEAASGVSNCATSRGASTSNSNVGVPSASSGTTPAPNRRRRRRCWMIIKD